MSCSCAANQIQVDEFPPFNSITKLQNTPGVTMYLFPSTRTDYLDMNEEYPPLADVHVRRAISYAIDRKAIIKSVLFGHGKPANSFLPPQVPFYSKARRGLQFNMAKAKAEMAKSKYPKGFKVTLLVGAGAQVENAKGQILQSQLKQLGINVTLQAGGHATEFQDIQKQKYQLGFSYWTMDIADPDELVTFAIDPAGGAHSFYTELQQPEGDRSSRTRRSGRRTRRSGRQLYAQLQTLAAKDAFLGFLYYSPYRWAYSSKLHGFFV